jgi:hypothetical protein
MSFLSVITKKGIAGPGSESERVLRFGLPLKEFNIRFGNCEIPVTKAITLLTPHLIGNEGKLTANIMWNWRSSGNRLGEAVPAR